MPSKRTKKPEAVHQNNATPDLHSLSVEDGFDSNALVPKENTAQPTLKAFVHEAWSILEPVSTLQWNWHLDLICDYLTLVRDNKFKTKCGEHLEGFIFNVPPRTMKSLLITVFFPIWLWTTDPARRLMFVSYSEKLSTQHSVFRRSVIESPWYQKYWGRVFSFSKDQNLKSHYENSRRGTMFSTGMQATATGLGGDVLIFDDPLNPEQAVSQLEREAVNLRFDTTFRSRINDPATGVKIIIMQRLHELDLTGHVLGREKSRWLHLRLPAIAEKDETWQFPSGKETHQQKAGDLLWSERLPQSFLESQRIGMGSWAFNGQYQQSPAPLDGGIIKRQWVRFYRQLPEKFDFMVQSWDCTFSGGTDNDFVAGQVWARSGSKYYLLPYRTYDRLDFGPTMAAIKTCHVKFPGAHAILIENKANGPAIISELQKEIGGVIAVNPEGGKLARAQAMAPLWESGSIELPDPQLFDAPWIEDYLHNICAFPKAAHDDDVDATSQALIYMRTRLGGGIIDFYRQQATDYTCQSSENASGCNKKLSRFGPQAPGFPTRTGVVCVGAEMPSPAQQDSTLARNVIKALAQGSQIQCHEKQYPEIRAVLARAAEKTDQETGPALMARREMDRLDQDFNWKTPLSG
ncbi:MAG TPA: phage terminase large subunit [Candidatus Angelobacter sp.]|nr:phage terminase large subunit [Candidatus Angelobacter sp.]